MTVKERVSVDCFAKQLKELEQTLKSKKDKMEIVIAGNVKAGKSTLINAIFKDETLCETGVVRTTASNKIIEADNYRLMDTPGINANDQDTEVAEQGYEQADFFLFTHNVIDGELLAKEIEFLQQVKMYFRDEAQFVRNTFIILTNAHQLEDEHLITAIERIKQQIKLITELEIQLFVVDSVSYLTALQENKTLLMGNSGISALQSALEEKAKEFNVNVISEREGILKVRKDNILEGIEDYYSVLIKDLSNLQEQIIDISAIKSLLKEIKKFPNTVNDVVKNGKNVNLGYSLYVDRDLSKLYAQPHRVEYKSYSRAQSEGVNAVRNYLLPRVEKAYINNRRELIDNYRNLLPNYGGSDSSITKLQNQIEVQLTELKSSLLPLSDILDIKDLATSNTVLNVPLQKEDQPALRHSSSIYASGFEDCYDIESASWYEPWVEVVDSITYKEGFLEVKKWTYMDMIFIL